MNKINPLYRYLIAVTIYGTIGFFLHFVNAQSEFVVFCRGLIGGLFIGLVMLISKQYPDLKSIKNNLLYIAISGIALGLNWLFLFAGYRYSVAIASLLNYTAPIIVVIITAVFFRERLNKTQIMCIVFAFIGIACISGIFETSSTIDIHCIIYGLLAAVAFVFIVLCNRKIHDVKPLDKTITQLLFSAITVLPYVLINDSVPKQLDTVSIILLICLGVIHTGIAYIFYFNSIDTLQANKVAIFGYIEPVLTVLTGALVFHEKLSVFGIIGAILILTSALVNELVANKQ